MTTEKQMINTSLRESPTTAHDAMEQYAIQTQQNESPYFYHSDHLGSASWITDDHGIPVQHLQYLPFGEPFVNQRASGSNYNEPFTFTGKEKDSETGFYYFGARYYDPALSGLFISVDPMVDKYPNLSPYAYCAWNPVNLIDPNWDTIRIQDDNGQFQYIELSHISSLCNSKDSREKALYFMSNDAEGYAILKGLSISSVYYDIKNKSNMKGGRVDDERIVVWGKPANNYGGNVVNIILEELFHCAQYEGINNMTWTGDIETEEIPAKEFSARVFPYFERYFETQGFWVSTEMNIMAGGYQNVDSFSSQDKQNFLTPPMALQTYLSDPTKGVIQYHTQKYTSKPTY